MILVCFLERRAPPADLQEDLRPIRLVKCSNLYDLLFSEYSKTPSLLPVLIYCKALLDYARGGVTEACKVFDAALQVVSDAQVHEAITECYVQLLVKDQRFALNSAGFQGNVLVQVATQGLEKYPQNTLLLKSFSNCEMRNRIENKFASWMDNNTRMYQAC